MSTVVQELPSSTNIFLFPQIREAQEKNYLTTWSSALDWKKEKKARDEIYIHNFVYIHDTVKERKENMIYREIMRFLERSSNACGFLSFLLNFKFIP